MLLSEDILIRQDILIYQEQWHKYTNYMSCSNFTKALSKIQNHSLTASFEFLKSFHLEWNPEWANRFMIKTSFSSRTKMNIRYQALCNLKYNGYLNSPTDQSDKSDKSDKSDQSLCNSILVPNFRRIFVWTNLFIIS